MSVHDRYLDALEASGLIVREQQHKCCDHIYDSYCPCCMSECEAWGVMTNEGEVNA
jgi:hypothetical protein